MQSLHPTEPCQLQTCAPMAHSGEVPVVVGIDEMRHLEHEEPVDPVAELEVAGSVAGPGELRRSLPPSLRGRSAPAAPTRRRRSLGTSGRPGARRRSRRARHPAAANVAPAHRASSPRSVRCRSGSRPRRTRRPTAGYGSRSITVTCARGCRDGRRRPSPPSPAPTTTTRIVSPSRLAILPTKPASGDQFSLGGDRLRVDPFDGGDRLGGQHDRSSPRARPALRCRRSPVGCRATPPSSRSGRRLAQDLPLGSVGGGQARAINGVGLPSRRSPPTGLPVVRSSPNAPITSSRIWNASPSGKP